MGSRGAKSGFKRRGLRITTADGTTFSYEFYKGKVMNKDTNQIIPLTLDQISKRAKLNGANTEFITERQLIEQDKRDKKAKEEADKQLNELWGKAAGRPRKGWKGH